MNLTEINIYDRHAAIPKKKKKKKELETRLFVKRVEWHLG